MKKVTIFVACHKPAEVKNDIIHTPIHVGRAISKWKKEMALMIGDDTDDNISEKNPFYSEMTAQYWAWKNYHESEYIGFCHYRRYFVSHEMETNFDNLFADGTDVIFNEPRFRLLTRYAFFSNSVGAEDRFIMQNALLKLYPDYYQTYLLYANGFKDYVCNMFICRKALFDQYAEWIFSILFECEKSLRLSSYTRARRVYGYMSEFLMPVFFLHHNCKIKCLPYQDSAGKIIKMGTKTKIKIKLLTFLRHKHLYDSIKMDPAVEAGLRMDGIL